MKWIKASERQPEDWGSVIVCEVYEAAGRQALYGFNNDSYDWWMNEPNGVKYINDLEWLDESPEPVTIGIDGGPLYRPYFQIGNQTFYIDAHNPEDYKWYVDQMEAAFKKLPVEVNRID